MSKDANRCDACGRRIRHNHHGLVLTYPLSGQEVGRYHARGACQEAAVKYLTGGAVLAATFVHPLRCGDNQERCDAGLSEFVA